jgi:transposase
MIERRDGRCTDRKTLEHIRINAIERWKAGERPLDIIRGTGFCETTIYKWITRCKKGGLEALYSTKASGAEAKLSESQQNRLKELIVGKDPSRYGFESNLWTRRIIAELIKKEYDISMGLTQVGVLLAKLKITPQKPTREAKEQDPETVREWKEVKFPAILEEARTNNAELFFWDEAGYRLDDQVGRTWGQRGKTPVVKCTGKRARTNSAIAMSINGAFWFEEFDGNLNSDRFCEILDRFMKTRRGNVVLIMDKHPTHTSKATNEHIDKYGSRLKVEPLPGYSPELNPVEYVNHYAKANGPRKQLPLDKFDLSKIVQRTLGALKGAIQMVKSFFNHEKLDYINIDIT